METRNLVDELENKINNFKNEDGHEYKRKRPVKGPSATREVGVFFLFQRVARQNRSEMEVEESD